MPKKNANAVANGGEPSANSKRRRLESKDEGASSEDNEAGHGEDTASSAVPSKANLVAVKDELLREMCAIVKPKDRYKNFDFSQMNIKGYSGDQLRAVYDRLRESAFRRIRRVPLQQEINFVREYEIVSAMAEKEDKPKRPQSAYLRFLEDEKPKLRKKNPEVGKNLMTMIPIIAEKWRNLSPEKKRRYQEAYEEDRKEYFLANPSTVKPKKTTAGGSGSGGRAAKTTVHKAKSAFELFCEAKKKEYSEKYDLKGEALMEKMASKFAKLSDHKREKWERLAKESMDNYIQDLVNKRGSQQHHLSEEHGSVDKATKKKKSAAHSSNAAADANADYMDYLTADGDQTDSSPQHSSKSAGKNPTKKQQTKNAWLD